MFAEDYFDLDDLRREQRQKTGAKETNNETKNKSRLIVNLLTVAIIIGSVVLGYYLFTVSQYYIDIWKTNRLSQQGLNIQDDQSPQSTPGLSAAATAPGEVNIPGDAVPAGTPLGAAPVTRQYIQNLREVYNNNDDVVGWLTITGTGINYPLVQCADNDFYLKHDADKNPSSIGWIFADCNCDLNNLGCNTVIYGHNIKGGSMFHDLRYFADESYYKDHRYITLRLNSGDTTWEIFSFYSTTTDFDYIATTFDGQQAFGDFVALTKEKSAYDTGVGVSGSDKVLTLSTCTNRPDDSRYVLMAKLVQG